MSARFTPGPWEASLEAARFIIQHVPEHGLGKRALACTAGSEPANPFNAYLIAAAPDLYEALEALASTIDGQPHEGHGACIEDALQTAWSALAKARGEQP